jgi:FAD/FMN-containing dehydrogenase
MMSTLDVTGLDGGAVGLPTAHLDDLRRRLTGPILLPDHPSWADAVRIWNGAAARHPAVVVQPACPADVAATVDFAVTRGLLLAVKGGGHNVAGTALAQGGLVMDMSGLHEVAVDVDARLVHVGAAACWPRSTGPRSSTDWRPCSGWSPTPVSPG